MSQPLTQSTLAKASPWTVRIQFWLPARALGCPCLQLPPSGFPDPQGDPGLVGLLAPKWQPLPPLRLSGAFLPEPVVAEAILPLPEG